MPSRARSRSRADAQGAPRLWTPTRESNLHAWWDARYISGVSNNTSFTPWTDLSPNAYQIAQGTSSKRPKYMSSVSQFNNKPAVRFDGIDDVFTITGLALNSSAYTIYIAYRMIGSDTGGCFGMRAAGKADHTNNGLFTTYQVVTQRLYRNGEVSAATNPATSTATLVTCLFDGTNATIRSGSTVGISTARSGAFAGEGWQMGSRYNGTTFTVYTNLDIAAVIVYSKAISFGSTADLQIKQFLSPFGV